MSDFNSSLAVQDIGEKRLLAAVCIQKCWRGHSTLYKYFEMYIAANHIYQYLLSNQKKLQLHSALSAIYDILESPHFRDAAALKEYSQKEFYSFCEKVQKHFKVRNRNSSFSTMVQAATKAGNLQLLNEVINLLSDPKKRVKLLHSQVYEEIYKIELADLFAEDSSGSITAHYLGEYPSISNFKCVLHVLNSCEFFDDDKYKIWENHYHPHHDVASKKHPSKSVVDEVFMINGVSITKGEKSIMDDVLLSLDAHKCRNGYIDKSYCEHGFTRRYFVLTNKYIVYYDSHYKENSTTKYKPKFAAYLPACILGVVDDCNDTSSPRKFVLQISLNPASEVKDLNVLPTNSGIGSVFNKLKGGHSTENENYILLSFQNPAELQDWLLPMHDLIGLCKKDIVYTNLEIRKLWLSKQNKYGDTVLHKLALSSNVLANERLVNSYVQTAFACWCIEHGCPLDAKNEDGMTALSLAIMYKADKNVIDCLIDKGAAVEEDLEETLSQISKKYKSKTYHQHHHHGSYSHQHHHHDQNSTWTPLWRYSYFRLYITNFQHSNEVEGFYQFSKLKISIHYGADGDYIQDPYYIRSLRLENTAEEGHDRHRDGRVDIGDTVNHYYHTFFLIRYPIENLMMMYKDKKAYLKFEFEQRETPSVIGKMALEQLRSNETKSVDMFQDKQKLGKIEFQVQAYRRQKELDLQSLFESHKITFIDQDYFRKISSLRLPTRGSQNGLKQIQNSKKVKVSGNNFKMNIGKGEKFDSKRDHKPKSQKENINAKPEHIKISNKTTKPKMKHESETNLDKKYGQSSKVKVSRNHSEKKPLAQYSSEIIEKRINNSNRINLDNLITLQESNLRNNSCLEIQEKDSIDIIKGY